MVIMADVGWFIGLGLWSAAIVIAIKPLHGYFMKKGCEDMVAVYYNRKIAHMLAGGVPILASPIVFSDPLWPLLGGLIGAAILASTHLVCRLLLEKKKFIPSFVLSPPRFVLILTIRCYNHIYLM